MPLGGRYGFDNLGGLDRRLLVLSRTCREGLAKSFGHFRNNQIDEATQDAALSRGVDALLNKERLAEDLVPRVQAALTGQ